VTDNNYAAAMLIATIESALEALKSVLGMTTDGGCEHTDKEDLSTFGGPPRWRCKSCGYTYTEGGADAES
jgi:transposase-like protein